MSDIWLTSDLHFCHNQEFIYVPRGFSCVEEMNEAIVERWNNVVKSEDTVFILGDLMLNDNEKALEYIKCLNGQLLIIWGNHDSEMRQEFLSEKYPSIMSMGYAHQFKHGKLTLYLSHYPTLTANYDSNKHFNQNVINLHGHTHQTTNFLIPTNPFMYHVGLDSHNCTPVHIDETVSEIKHRWEEISHLPMPL